MNAEPLHATDPSVLRYLLAHNLNKLYYGKHYMIDNLPNLIEIASFKALQLALQELLDDVKKHIERLDAVYKAAGITPSNEDCIPVKAIFK